MTSTITKFAHSEAIRLANCAPTAMIYADDPKGRTLSVYRNGKEVRSLAAFNPKTGEAIEYLLPPYFGNLYLKLLLKYRYLSEIPTRHYFMKGFEVKWLPD